MNVALKNTAPNVEHTCRCGRAYMLVKVPGRQMTVLHKNPPCADFKNRTGEGFLEWMANPESPAAGVRLLNRKERRRRDRAMRKQGR